MYRRGEPSIRADRAARQNFTMPENMSEQGKQDHWSSLLSNLGVDAPAEEPSPEVPDEEIAAVAPVPPPPRPRPKSSVQPPAREPRRSPQDWLRLADDLGVAVPDEQRAIADVTEPEPATEPPPAILAERDPWTAEAAMPSVASESISEAEMALDDLDEFHAESEVEGQSVQRPEEEGERKLRRRRKRRRKTRRPEETPAVSREPQEDDSTDFVTAEVVDEEGEVEAFSLEAVQEEVDEEPAQKRPKRRRRRRSGRKKESQEDENTRSEPDETTAVEPEDEDFDSDDIEDGTDDEETISARREGRQREKPLHRGIPNWKEAIDVVISANLESRSKHPDRGSAGRGRGGRNRGPRERSDRNG